jgi:hypothetical protein
LRKELEAGDLVMKVAQGNALPDDVECDLTMLLKKLRDLRN